MFRSIAFSAVVCFSSILCYAEQKNDLLAPLKNPQISAEDNEARAAAERLSKTSDQCKEKMPALRKEYAKYMAAQNYWSAAVAIRSCAVASGSQELQRMHKTAEVRTYLEDINSKKTSPADKVRSLEALARDYPEEAKPYISRLRPLKNKAEDDAHSEEIERLRNAPLRIGMTEREVFNGRCGRPLRIHRTITAAGERKQWVCGSGLYVYFENGRVVAIQD